MSRVKKAVLFIIVVAALLLVSMNANAKGSAKIGGTFVNSESATVTGSFNYSWEQDKWQQTFESDFQYKKEDDKETMNELFLNTKANYTFAPKHYAFGVAQYDYDKFRADGDRKVLGFGYGYKLLRTEKFKASNEFSIAQLNTDTISEMILRNSLWFSYKVSTNVNFTNKFLYEEGSQSDVFIRNETALNYNFKNGTVLSFNNTYTEDPVDNNVLSVTIGKKW
jgi:putative salt-induced outer membrane protein|tara:strand:+ start:1004 stop:1672 length:669 start_codon:yes stop_codon:yes gene_type:complete